jgi:hypothetical protein
VLTHPWEVFIERWNWKAALLSAIFRGVAFAAPMTSLVGGEALRSLWIEMCFRVALGGFWGSLLQEFRDARPGWLAGIWIAVILPAMAHSMEYLVLHAGHVTHIKTGMVVSVALSAGSMLINLALMRRGILITGENGESLRSDLRRIPVTLGEVFRGVSRRAFLGALAGAAMVRVCRSAEINRSDRLAWNMAKEPQLSLHRRYRADAQILALGVRILQRERVGEGNVIWREFDMEGSVRLLEFAGFSVPERAAGVNRLGFLREIARAGGSAGECLYFGLMTASSEESEEQARRPLRAQTGEQTYTAIDGRIEGGSSENAKACFTAPAALSAEHREELVERAHRALAYARRTSTTPGEPRCAHSFLQTLAGLLMAPERNEGRYLYSGRIYQMRLARSRDERAAQYFRERGIISAGTEVLRVGGKVRQEAGGRETEFRLWISNSGERPLPLRIEYQAKPYLRLFFEAESA